MELLGKILDPGSFVEQGARVDNAGAVCGYGTIGDKLVFIYCQTGPVSLAHAKKIGKVYDDALKVGVPVIGVLSAGGLALEEAFDSLEAYGNIFQKQVQASGVIPQIAVIEGDCLGIAAYMAGLSDFVFTVEGQSRFFLQSPNVYGKNGCDDHKILHMACKDATACGQMVRELAGYLPTNNLDIPWKDCTDDLNREDAAIGGYLTEEDGLQKIFRSIGDNGAFFEIQGDTAQKAVTGFVKLNGGTTGVIGTTGILCGKCMDKIRNFVVFCDAFSIPLVTFSQTQGYAANHKQDAQLIYQGAKLISAFIGATAPKVNIVLKEAVGSPYLLMNSRQIGADVSYIWENGSISLVENTASQAVLGQATALSAEQAAAKGYVDDVIPPAVTRKRIISALEMLSGKRPYPPTKKHNSIL